MSLHKCYVHRICRDGIPRSDHIKFKKVKWKRIPEEVESVTVKVGRSTCPVFGFMEKIFVWKDIGSQE